MPLYRRPGTTIARPGSRRADRLVELCQPRAGGSADGAGPRPHLIIRASVDTLIGAPGSPGGDLDGGTIIPAETVRRIACDAAIRRIIGKGELDAEITRASRSTPPATRRALAVRDRGCVAEHCTRPLAMDRQPPRQALDRPGTDDDDQPDPVVPPAPS